MFSPALIIYVVVVSPWLLKMFIFDPMTTLIALFLMWFYWNFKVKSRGITSRALRAKKCPSNWVEDTLVSNLAPSWNDLSETTYITFKASLILARSEYLSCYMHLTIIPPKAPKAKVGLAFVKRSKSVTLSYIFFCLEQSL